MADEQPQALLQQTSVEGAALDVKGVTLPEECCGRCRFARFEIAAPHLRDCAYNPPRIFMGQGPRGPMFITEFPKVKMTMWCGKFQKKKLNGRA